MTDCVFTGFDRGVNYHEIKDKLVKEYKIVTDTVTNNRLEYLYKYNKLVYLNVAMIQLKNGSRVSEAVGALKKFLSSDEKKVTVKISKTQSIKTKKNGEKFETKARFRHMVYPDWVKLEEPKILLTHLEKMSNPLNNTLQYLDRYFDCNTHSLRYSFVNYAMTEKKIPIAIIAKFIGHANVNQIVTYSSRLESDKLFDL